MEFIVLLSAVTANYKNLDKGGKHFFLKKITTKKSLHWGTLAERSLIFSKTKLSLRQYIDILSKCAQKWQALLFLSQSER